MHMKTQKLWQKDNCKSHPLVEKYTVGDDFVLDNTLLPYDIKASAAHVFGLAEIGVLSSAELENIIHSLNQLLGEWQAGKIKVAIEDEDCHTLIENYLVEHLGETGKKIHTGRSRNDQVLVALRLLMKDHAEKIGTLIFHLTGSFLNNAKKYQLVPLPGYSHTQQAMLSSVGHYYSAIAAGLIDDMRCLKFVNKLIDVCPLGSAAGFGVSLPLKREGVAQELGFGGVQVNSLYCQNSRGKYESVYLEALSQVMQTLSKWATDMLFFTSYECQYFKIAPELTTGSSIMPHKKNADGLEILRANASVISANQFLIKELGKNLLSGYNRDFQLMKKPLIDSIQIVEDSLEIAMLFFSGISPQTIEIEKRINQDIFMADYANQLVKEKGVPFREAYKLAVSQHLEGKVDLVKNIKSKISPGAPGNLQLDFYWSKLKEIYEKS